MVTQLPLIKSSIQMYHYFVLFIHGFAVNMISLDNTTLMCYINLLMSVYYSRPLVSDYSALTIGPRIHVRVNLLKMK